MCVLGRGQGTRQDLARVFLGLVWTPPVPPDAGCFPSTMSKQEGARLAAGLQLVSFVSEVAVTPPEKGSRNCGTWGSGQGRMALGSPQALLQLPERALGGRGPQAASRSCLEALAQSFSESGPGPW